MQALPPRHGQLQAWVSTAPHANMVHGCAGRLQGRGPPSSMQSMRAVHNGAWLMQTDGRGRVAQLLSHAQQHAGQV